MLLNTLSSHEVAELTEVVLKQKDPVVSISQHINSTKVDVFTKEEEMAEARKSQGSLKDKFKEERQDIRPSGYSWIIHYLVEWYNFLQFFQHNFVFCIIKVLILPINQDSFSYT